MPNYQMLEDNNNMKKNKDFKNRQNKKEMNSKELSKNKKKKENQKLNYFKKKMLWSKNMLKNLKNKFYLMMKLEDNKTEIDLRKGKKLGN